MDTNELLRERALRLVNLGLSQKVLAARMDMAPSTFSKWLNAVEGIGPADLPAFDGFNAFIAELRAALDADPDAIRQTGGSESHTPPAAHASSSNKRGGRTLAEVPPVPHDHSDPVSSASRQEVRRLAADLLSIAREAEQAGRVEKPARADRAVGEHAAAPRDSQPVHRARVRKRSR